MCVGVAAALVWAEPEEDDPVVETGGATPQPEVLEEQPAVDELPPWLLETPQGSEDAEGETREPPRPVEYVVEDKHVVSESRMFSVSGGDVLRMGILASRADDIRKHFNKLLGIPNEWKYGISIRLWGTTADRVHLHPIRTHVRIIGSEPNLQIRIYAGGGINLEHLDEAIVTMLLYEYALRGVQAAALPETIQMPSWLVVGVQQAMLWREGRIDRRLYQTLFNKAEMMTPEDIINTQPEHLLDAGSRQVYEVSCGVLILGLLHQEDGAQRLRSLMAEALTQNVTDLREVIGTYFHELNLNKTNFTKWWALELATLAMPSTSELLTPLETEKRLNEALTFTGVQSGTRLPLTVNLHQLEQFEQLPDWRNQLYPCMTKLTRLNLTAFPGYREIISEYLNIVTRMANGSSPREEEKALAPLADLRRAYTKASTRGRDYLDWYEITHLKRVNTDSFARYEETMRLLRKQAAGPSTPISRYLDDIETLHELPPGEPLPDRLRPPSGKRTR